MYSLKPFHVTHTELSKYLILRFWQLTNIEERISRKSPYSNGLTLLKEILAVAESATQRQKSIRRLKTILDEALDISIRTSVANDLVIEKHFPSVYAILKDYSTSDFGGPNLRLLKSEIEILTHDISSCYYKLILDELFSIDFNSSKFTRNADQIDKLLELLVAQLLYEGHSFAYLGNVASNLPKWKIKNLRSAFSKIATQDLRIYSCFHPSSESPVLADVLGARRLNLDEQDFWELDNNDNTGHIEGYSFLVSGKDAFSALLNTVDERVRKRGLINPGLKPEIASGIWDNCLYEIKGKYSKYDFTKNVDPVVTSARPNTLNRSLEELNIQREIMSPRIISAFEESLYFYNLGHSVSSVEASYTLLWTSLESLMGLRLANSDIQQIQDSVAPIIAIGAPGRRVASFASMFATFKPRYGWPSLEPEQLPRYSSEWLFAWFRFLIDRSTEGTPEDPYNFLKDNAIMSRQYLQLNSSWKSSQDIAATIVSSEKSLRYHLERFYQVRNNIVHSANFLTMTGYLWLQLEWLVGKMLALGLTLVSENDTHLEIDPRDVLFSRIKRYRILVDDLLSKDKGTDLLLNDRPKILFRHASLSN